ncbi:DUF1462 family protein [Pradoshia sp. D12]|uniref:YuzD family protein n=1 Tax=Bacillaceae TaxID=186817 RepID=UPI00111D17D7|nr:MULTISPECIES: YuzD family protein [unclassified Bacillus (in: firmicutes)]QFK72685.1 DUF1462 family protein [Pradoshia sp. D12]TPF71679.1 DUF1462 family protein [Bacillus sp. D12]
MYDEKKSDKIGGKQVTVANLYVYGATQICASCVGMPSSKETYEWLQAALSRKFPSHPLTITYIDIFNPPEDPKIKEIAEKVAEGEYFYPLVILDGKVVGEGSPRLKVITEALRDYGYKSE